MSPAIASGAPRSASGRRRRIQTRAAAIAASARTKPSFSSKNDWRSSGVRVRTVFKPSAARLTASAGRPVQAEPGEQVAARPQGQDAGRAEDERDELVQRQQQQVVEPGLSATLHA